MLEKLVTATVARRPLASVAALGAMSVIACVSLTACDAAAEHRASAPIASTTAPAVAASMPSVSMGGAALREYREDADPSHLSIGNYKD